MGLKLRWWGGEGRGDVCFIKGRWDLLLVGCDDCFRWKVLVRG